MNAETPASDRQPASVPDPNTLTEFIRDVDGVTDLFAPAPAITQVPHLVSAIATGQDERYNRVDIATRGVDTIITARIGVTRRVPAPDTARHVADTILDSIGDYPNTTVAVQIFRIA